MGAQHLRVGLLVLAALVVFMATIFSLGQQEHLWERKVEYEMRFPDDPGVSFILVRIKVGGDVAPRIRENTVATIRTLGLLGDRYIELSAGSADAHPLEAGGV